MFRTRRRPRLAAQKAISTERVYRLGNNDCTYTQRYTSQNGLELRLRLYIARLQPIAP